MLAGKQSKSIDRKARKNDQQRRTNCDDTFSTDAKSPETNLQLMAHGAALRKKLELPFPGDDLFAR
jgi:hypothetical protein